MNLLLDANLSWRLIKKLEPTYNEVFHANQIGLTIPPSDIEIWKWAKLNNSIIVTNDDDYYYLMLQKGFPPKIILLRTGNLNTSKTATLLMNNHLKIKLWDKNNTFGILEII